MEGECWQVMKFVPEEVIGEVLDARVADADAAKVSVL
jgi:hypothetical protein